jgi:hypothetical protein
MFAIVDAMLRAGLRGAAWGTITHKTMTATRMATPMGGMGILIMIMAIRMASAAITMGR